MQYDLEKIMEFYHVIRVNPDLSITEQVDDVYAPELVMSVDADGQILPEQEAEYVTDAKAQGWDLLSGWSSQYGYNGIIMHPSEYIGGYLAEHIADTPGLYTVILVNTDDGQAAGWAIAHRDIECPVELFQCPCCGYDVMDSRPICSECERAGCERTTDSSGERAFTNCEREFCDDCQP